MKLPALAWLRSAVVEGAVVAAIAVGVIYGAFRHLRDRAGKPRCDALGGL